MLIEALIEKRAVDTVFVDESSGGMITSGSTAGHRLEVSNCNLRTNSSLVCIGALRAPGPSTCLAILSLIVDLSSDSSLGSPLLFPQVFLGELSYFRVIREFGSMVLSFVHTNRCEGLATADRRCL